MGKICFVLLVLFRRGYVRLVSVVWLDLFMLGYDGLGLVSLDVVRFS